MAVVAACLSLASATGHPAEVTDSADDSRNIVLILTDDQRFDALGLLNDYFRTPNLDRLAEAGILFENAFVTTSLCSPSRASILSGQYAHAHQVLDNSTPMSRDIPTFPQGLRDQEPSTWKREVAAGLRRFTGDVRDIKVSKAQPGAVESRQGG